MTGIELYELLYSKWNKSYDIQLKKVKEQIFCQIMWKYLEQASFPMTEQEYFKHLDAVANYITTWNSEQEIIAYLQATKERPRLGKPVSIPLSFRDKDSEWILDD